MEIKCDADKESKQVSLKDHPFLLGLTEQGMTYQGENPDKVITVLASKGNYDDWAAYFETPWSGKRVAEYGNKLPEAVAQDLFPEWAKSFKYRP